MNNTTNYFDNNSVVDLIIRYSNEHRHVDNDGRITFGIVSKNAFSNLIRNIANKLHVRKLILDIDFSKNIVTFHDFEVDPKTYTGMLLINGIELFIYNRISFTYQNINKLDVIFMPLYDTHDGDILGYNLKVYNNGDLYLRK